MPCPEFETFSAFRQRVGQKAAERRIPVFGTIELSYKCNLRCVHCYLPSHAGGDDMSTSELLDLVEQLAEAGCLFLLLTGGEPLLRPDFPEIYGRVKSLGIIPYIFTNGVCLPPERLALLIRQPPYLVDVSLYGASDETYRRVTGQPAFGRVMDNLRALRAAGLRLQVKITLVRPNLDDLPAMVAAVESLGLAVRLNAVMTYRYDGDDTPAAVRLSPAEIAACEASCPTVAALWQRSFAIAAPRERDPDHLYSCGAGRNSFAITPSGRLLICGTEQREWVSLRRHRFAEAWRLLGAVVENRYRRPDHPCRGCSLSPWCPQCAARAERDMGDEQAVVPYLCEATHRRAALFASERLREAA